MNIETKRRASSSSEAPRAAVILVGGQGTRLRPLTERTPKPMLPVLGRPLLAYTFDQLRAAGVERAVLACGYLPTQIEAEFGDSVDGLSLEYRVEPEPLGTGGGIRFAADGIEETFVALNGDSLREVELRRLLAFHRDRKAKATILLTRVEDASRYGLVRVDREGHVLGFVEKPSMDEIDTDLINAGLYLLEPEVLEHVPLGRAVSIERDVFPSLAARGELYALPLPGYWLDVGTPGSYLQAHLDLLARRACAEVDAAAEVDPAAELGPSVLVGAGAVVEARARLGPLAYVGLGARVGAGASVERAVVLPRAVVPAGTRVSSAILAPGIGAVSA